MDILFLLIPLSVALALLILGGSGMGRMAWSIRLTGRRGRAHSAFRLIFVKPGEPGRRETSKVTKRRCSP